jgi:hypothetical protein
MPPLLNLSARRPTPLVPLCRHRLNRRGPAVAYWAAADFAGSGTCPPLRGNRGHRPMGRYHRACLRTASRGVLLAGTGRGYRAGGPEPAALCRAIGWPSGSSLGPWSRLSCGLKNTELGAVGVAPVSGGHWRSPEEGPSGCTHRFRAQRGRRAIGKGARLPHRREGYTA